jgi:uncharacterized membrane protein
VTATATPARSSAALQTTVISAVGVAVSFIVAIVGFAGIDGGTVKSLTGADAVVGFPFVGISITFFATVLVASVAPLAGARFSRSWRTALVVLLALGTLFQIWAAVTGVSWYSIVLALLALAALVIAIRSARTAGALETSSTAPQVASSDRPRVLGVFAILAGIAGLTASINLSFDKVSAILSPGTALSCDRSILVNCGHNLASWQGSLLGFPNPLIGLGGFAAPIVIGFAILLGAKLTRWFWVAFNLGVVLAFALIVFLISQSVFVINTLCLWCALVWLFTIPLFWLVTLYNIKTGNIHVGPRATKFFAGAYTFVPLITLVCYAIVFLLYVVFLNALSYL